MRILPLLLLLSWPSLAAWTVNILRFEKGNGKVSVVYTLTDSVSGEVIQESAAIETAASLKQYLTNRINQITNLYALAATVPPGVFDPTVAVIPPPAGVFTYNVLASQITAAASKDYLNLFNAVGSGKVMRVTSIIVAPANTATVVGSAANFTVSKTSTAGATCTSLAIQKMDTTAAAVPVQVAASSNCTTKQAISFDLFACGITPEETLDVGQRYCYQQQPGEGSLTIREGEGLTVRTTALAPVGLVSVAARFIM